MNVEVLVIPDCPHSEPAAARVRQVLTELGLDDVEVSTRVITDQVQAERTGFTGSPTLLIDGHDPFTEPGRQAGLACRVYRTPDGFSGLPSPGQLRQALTSEPSQTRGDTRTGRVHEGKHGP
ncbi:hypothetical protein [Streptomyces sp. TBY4]|uniref:DF family (seleno)protein n=1 Tax=Streptomyces sp. TBY4 TaxID=2962030 RepID=UPI0020B73188|nr:hypothetical protein [Streptomyces sp. TBY4]MCP3759690.1 hypothetical protein [Streptomyces sp. TBY4]